MLRLTGLLLFSIACMAQTADPFYGRGVWRERVVDFRIVNGWAVYQGDIIIGRAADLAARLEAALDPGAPGAKGRRFESLAVADQTKYWPKGVIPYEIDPTFRDTRNIEAAIQHWNGRTAIRLEPRSGETNYVRFAPYSDPTVCASSALGMTGGRQFVYGNETCPAASLVHEIGHAAGLEHEQSRSDRDRHVRILWENISKFSRNQYLPLGNDIDVGPYDYYSIMHYGVGDFGVLGAAMETIPAGIPIRQEEGLSDGDIDAVNRLYGAAPASFTVSTTPPGLQVIVDGQTVTAPRTFPWAPGSTHTLEAADQTDGRGKYVFARWSDEGDCSHSISVSASATLYVANFVRHNRYNLHVAPEGAGTVTLLPPSDDGYYRDGTVVFLLAVPNAGYTFRNWSGPYIDQVNLQNFSPNPWGVYAHGQYQDLTANFTPRATSPGPGPPAGTTVRFLSTTAAGASVGGVVRVDGRLYNAPVAFVWEPGSTHTAEVDAVFPKSSSQSLVVFQRWADGGDRQRTMTVTDQPVTYTAIYNVKFGIGLLSNNGGRVTVSPQSTDTGNIQGAFETLVVQGLYYDQGSTVELNGLPTGTNRFVGWAQDIGGAENPKSLVLNETISVFGFFAAPNAASGLGVVNTARLRPNIQVSGNSVVTSVSPGEVVTIRVPDFGPDAQSDAVPGPDGRLPTTLADTRALIGGAAVPLLSVAKGQVTAIVPYDVAGLRAVTVALEYQGARTAAGAVAVNAANPGIYTIDNSGGGQARAVNEEGSPNAPDAPAARGSVVTFYATGLGAAVGAADGQTGPDPGPAPIGTLEVRIGAAVAEIVRAGIAPGQAGIYRIQARIPAGARTGKATSLVVTVDGAPSQYDVTMAVE